jgi:hypothetical protein
MDVRENPSPVKVELVPLVAATYVSPLNFAPEEPEPPAPTEIVKVCPVFIVCEVA